MNDSSLLVNTKEIDPRYIFLGDGRTITSMLQGDAVLNVVLRSAGSNPMVTCITLRKELFVPKMELNLVSCSALCADGYHVQFGPDGCSVMKESNLLISSHVRNGLYPVETCRKKIAVN